MTKPKTLLVGQILTQKEMKEALRLYKQCGDHKQYFAERCASEIIRPALTRINEATGQENDPKYLAYTIEYAIMKSGGKLHS